MPRPDHGRRSTRHKHTATVAEAAQMLGVSRISVYRAVWRGELEATRLGRRVLIPLVAIHRLLHGGA
jgi:excisionase family DNA binding protein